MLLLNLPLNKSESALYMLYGDQAKAGMKAGKLIHRLCKQFPKVSQSQGRHRSNQLQTGISGVGQKHNLKTQVEISSKTTR